MPSLTSRAQTGAHHGFALATFLVLLLGGGGALLAGCGGGGGGALPDDPPPPPDPAESLAPKASFDVGDLKHFLMRTHFGVRAAELTALQSQGLPAYVDAMLVLPAIGSSAVEQAAAAILVNPSDPVGLEGQFPTQGQLGQWWAYMLQRSTTPFQEVAALFWHDHFAASNAGQEGGSLYWTRTHVNLWRGMATGNLKTLAVQMARDWLMLAWLDGLLNTDDAPNENFAREFWELFFLGVDQGYTQADIEEGARAWTGYRRRNNATTTLDFVEFDVTRHDAGAKDIFGVTIPGQNLGDDYQAMVDITFAQRPVELFIARKLLESFCYEDPSDAVVGELGALLRASGWELGPVFATLFKSDAFYSAKAKAGFVKNPVEHMVGLVRSSGLLIPERLMDSGLALLGQRPTQPPTVNGWPQDEEWLSAQQMLDRANSTNAVLTQRTYQAGLGINVLALLPPGTPTTAQVVDALVLVTNVTVTPAEHARYVQYLDEDVVAGNVVASPFSLSDLAEADRRVRGLLYVLGQHPTYPVR